MNKWNVYSCGLHTLQYQDQPYVAQSAQGGIINALARGGQPMSIQDFPRKPVFHRMI